MRQNAKRYLSIVLILVLLVQALGVGAFAAQEASDTPVYKNFVIFGDSICLGFSTAEASMQDADTYDIEANLLRAAQSPGYRHCYPTQFALRAGIDTFSDLSYADGERWDYRTETDWNDVYNFGICAAWTRDILELLTDPYYLYAYASVNYSEEDRFVLPEEYVGTRPMVDTEAEGYQVEDSSTWVYLTGEEYIDHYEEHHDWWTGQLVQVPVYKTEEYSIPAGAAIPVAFRQAMWGASYLMLNPIIMEKYYYVSEHSLDDEGNFIDRNHDGTVDNTDILYYPVKAQQGPWGEQMAPDTEKYGATLGRAIQNPQFTKYYYDLSTTATKEGDLIALAMGNNDIYHSFMPYQQSSDSMLCRLVYWLTYALQMNYTISGISQMFQDPMWQNIIFPDGLGIQMNAVGMEALEGDEEPGAGGDDDPPASADPGDPSDPGGLGSLGSLISTEEIEALFDLYSTEKVTAYLEEVVESYKQDYEATIQRVLELKPDKAELVLIGHYNPFGMVNYLTMLSEAAQNGELLEHLVEDLGVVGTLVQAIIGTPEQWSEINGMTEEELLDYTQQAGGELDAFLAALNGLDLSDPETDSALTSLIVDLSFPVSVLLVGNALQETYDNMNEFLREMAEKYDLAYIDVSDAPCSGRYDPHPTRYGHKWIADRLYETVIPEITASISAASTGSGAMTPLGNREFRLREEQSYRFLAGDGSYISAVFIDGAKLDQEEFAAVYAEGRYTFEKIMAGHSITVQFDRDEEGVRKYDVNVLGSYAKYGAGEGIYRPGDTVTINAGALDGFEFTGWQAEGVELEDANAAVTSFVMPANNVTVTATWKVAKSGSTGSVKPSGSTRSYDLSFETNGGTAIPPYTKRSGTVIELSAFYTARSGYYFAGWYLDKELTQPVTTLTLNGDTTVYAKWSDKDPSKLPFTDVSESDWFYKDVAYVYDKGTMKGVAEDLFGPQLVTTRGMIVTILYRLEGEPAVTGSCPFTDVAAGSYYEKAVTWAAGHEIVKGYGDDRFGPEDDITREQMAAILFRYASFKSYDVSARADLSKFKDHASVGSWAEEALSWANAQGLINGIDAETLAPQNKAVRSQVAAILHRFQDSIIR